MSTKKGRKRSKKNSAPCMCKEWRCLGNGGGRFPAKEQSKRQEADHQAKQAKGREYSE